jgi:DNA-binding NtrC family response regulator
MSTVLIVEDEPTPRKFLAKILSKHGYETIEAENLAIAQKVLEQAAADIVLLDIKLPDGNGLTLLDEIMQESPSLPVIVATGYADIDTVVDAMQNGAFDFIAKPIDAPRLLKSLENAGDQVKLYRELSQLRRERWSDQHWVQSSSKSMNIVNDLISRAAPTPGSVLLTGETGTGKSLVAGLLHTQSPRSNKACVTINCAAISDHMLESELFGHEANAFTGAGPKRKLGLMEVADESTLFLDEISTMKSDLQAKLLRALEDRVIRRVGGTKEIAIDIRLITATNRDIMQMISNGEFREDLYYRLNVVEIVMPPLRDRAEDIPALAGSFIKSLAIDYGNHVTGVRPRAMEAIVSYKWPGNIRELKNMIERALLLCDGNQIDIGHLPEEIKKSVDSTKRKK